MTHMSRKCGRCVWAQSEEGGQKKRAQRTRAYKLEHVRPAAGSLDQEQRGGKCRAVSLKKRSMQLSVPCPGSNYGIAGRPVARLRWEAVVLNVENYLVLIL